MDVLYGSEKSVGIKNGLEIIVGQLLDLFCKGPKNGTRFIYIGEPNFGYYKQLLMIRIKQAPAEKVIYFPS